MSALSSRFISPSIRFTSLTTSTSMHLRGILSLLWYGGYLKGPTGILQNPHLVSKDNCSNGYKNKVETKVSAHERVSNLNVKRTRTEKVVEDNSSFSEDLPYHGSWSDKTHICTFCGKSFFNIKGAGKVVDDSVFS